MIFHSEVLPEVDWSSPLADGLVALIAVKDGVVTDLVSGVQATGTPTIATTANGTGWTGRVTFPLDKLGIPTDLGSTIGFQTAGEFLNTNANGDFLRFYTASVKHIIATTYASWDNPSLEVYGAFNSTVPLNGTHVTGEFETIGATIERGNTATTSDVFTVSQAYTNGVYATGLAGVAQMNEEETALVTLDVGFDVKPLYFIAFYAKERTQAEFDAVNNDPYALFQTDLEALDEYGLFLDGGTAQRATLPSSIDIGHSYYIEITFQADPTNIQDFAGLLCDNTTSNSGASYIRISNANNLRWRIGANLEASTTDLSPINLLDGNEHTIRVQNGWGSDSTLMARMFVDGVEVKSDLNTSSFRGMLVGTIGTYWSSSHGWAGFIKQVKVISESYPTRSFIADFNQTSGLTVTDPLNGKVITRHVDSSFQRILPKFTFTETDYATLALLNSSENARSNEVVEYQQSTVLAGTTLTGFADGLIVKGLNDTAEINTALTISTSGVTVIESMICGDINATSATGNVYISNSEAANVTA